MQKINLDEIKKIELDMLIYIDKICKENDIKYNLASGTLLGAIKYKSFIPWDDDIDIVLMRDQYMKLMKVLENGAGKYKLLSIYNCKDYYYSFAKLVNTQTTLIENSKKINDMGVFIDIFPIDGYENKDIESQIKDIRFFRNMMVRRYRIKDCIRSEFDYMKFSKQEVKFKALKDLVYTFVDYITLPLGHNFWAKVFDKKMQKIKIEDCIYVGIRVNNFGIKEVFKKEEILEQAFYEFEGHKFTSFKNFDLYLTQKYGDYKKEPSEEQRKSHHLFTAYWRDDNNE